MKKNIIITSGPTNERLDAVMKITNMSTGALGAVITKDFIVNKGEDINKLYYLSTKLSRKPLIDSSKMLLRVFLQVKRLIQLFIVRLWEIIKEDIVLLVICLLMRLQSMLIKVMFLWMN